MHSKVKSDGRQLTTVLVMVMLETELTWAQVDCKPSNYLKIQVPITLLNWWCFHRWPAIQRHWLQLMTTRTS